MITDGARQVLRHPGPTLAPREIRREHTELLLHGGVDVDVAAAVVPDERDDGTAIEEGPQRFAVGLGLGRSPVVVHDVYTISVVAAGCYTSPVEAQGVSEQLRAFAPTGSRL